MRLNTCFSAQGVSRTSLQDIARRAGATRGAVYWHFKDKADLFNAMMERVTLPMEESFNHENEKQEAPGEASLNAIERIRLSTVNALRQIVTDAQTRRVFEVATQKVEYVEELQAVRLRHLAVQRLSGTHPARHGNRRQPDGPDLAGAGIGGRAGPACPHRRAASKTGCWTRRPLTCWKWASARLTSTCAALGFPGDPQSATAPARRFPP